MHYALECTLVIQCHEAKTHHEKIENLNYDSRVHSEQDPRAYKNAFTVNSAITGNEKIFRFGPILAPFCMGILVTLSLSKKKAPIGLKIFFPS